MQTTFVESDWTRRSNGEFSEHIRSAPEARLSDPTMPGEQLSARRAALRAEGHIPAATLLAGNPYVRVPAGQWWGLTESLNEVAATGYAVMPHTLGDGRRVNRKTYAGTETAVQMPSVHAIRAYAAEVGTTFDVPVEARTPVGPVTGHVRVTNNGNGTWSVSDVQMPSPHGSYVAETVSAILEARRPTRALTVIKDIVARRRERLASAGVRMRTLDSSWITGVGYNDADHQMVVEMGGRAYGYHVSRDAFEQTLIAASPGQAYNRLVKGSPRFPVEFHDACGRYFNSENEHRCASRHDDPADVRQRNARLMRGTQLS